MKLKKLHLITVSLFILTIFMTMIGLWILYFSNIHDLMINGKWKYNDGFHILKHYGFSYFMSHSANYISLISHSNENYYELIKLQTGIIFLIILVPLLIVINSIIIMFIFTFKISKINKQNNNFWDAIKNCEIINNYYIH